MKNQIVLINGATSGIGRHAALHLHARGHRVIACGRNRAALEELETAGLDAIRLDVTDPDSIAALHAEVDRRTDGYGVDVLVNNAGYGLVGPLEMLEDADVRHQFETNVFGLLSMTRTFLPAMRERGAGRVINVSSVGGRMTFPLAGAYHATKYAVEAMSDALRMEVAQFGVHVVLIEPGYIDTGFTGTSLDHLERYRTPGSPYAASLALADHAPKAEQRLAAHPRATSRAITHAIERRRPRARYVAPFVNALGPWLYARLPTRLIDWVFRRFAGLVPRRTPAALPSGA